MTTLSLVLLFSAQAIAAPSPSPSPEAAVVPASAVCEEGSPLRESFVDQATDLMATTTEDEGPVELLLEHWDSEGRAKSQVRGFAPIVDRACAGKTTALEVTQAYVTACGNACEELSSGLPAAARSRWPDRPLREAVAGCRATCRLVAITANAYADGRTKAQEQQRACRDRVAWLTQQIESHNPQFSSVRGLKEELDRVVRAVPGASSNAAPAR